MRRLPRFFTAFGVVLALSVIIGCGDGTPAEPASSNDNQGPRLVSLAPALTQMIVDLGMQD
ncbi:MAG: hypothetical protein R3C45_04705, partial [Phycisphaerales bacterium]